MAREPEFAERERNSEREVRPDPDLRRHALAAAIRAAEAVLAFHGYADPERSAEILHVALEDAQDDFDKHPDGLH